MSGVLDALDETLDSIDNETAADERPKPYVTAIPASQLFSDPGYQRPLDELRVQKMVDDYDETLLGVLEVSAHDDGRFAIVDGGHRWAAARQARGKDVHLVCNVHRGLSVEQEAQLFYEIDTRRRALTGWDRWWARRGAGDPRVLEIEAVAEKHGVRITWQQSDDTIQATKTLETIVELGGTSLLDATLAVVRRSFGNTADTYTSAILQGVALVLHHYIGDFDVERLIANLQAIPPRQLRARAVALREVKKGSEARLIAGVIVDRYRPGHGHHIESFDDRVPLQKRAKLDHNARLTLAIRQWAKRNGIVVPKHGRVPRSVREQYEAATAGERA